jgi:hypothetical protein
VTFPNTGAADRPCVGQNVRVQIDDTANRRSLRHVGLGLTEAEARELRDTLDPSLPPSTAAFD